jgi:glycine/D-amino acid oxidase-like deaminating enzyme
MAVASRSAPPALRSTVLGLVSAFGSLGAMFSAPIGQALSAAMVGAPESSASLSLPW